MTDIVMWYELCVALPDGNTPSCLDCEAMSKERCESTGIMRECPFDSEVHEPTALPVTLFKQFYIIVIVIVMTKYENHTRVNKQE